MDQQSILLHILNTNANTDYGKRYRFENIKNVQAFQRCVPTTSYDNYAPLIELMTRLGEYGIFTQQDISCYTALIGSMGTKKILPCTNEYQDLCYGGMSEILNGRNKSIVLFESVPEVKPTRDKKYINTIYGVLLKKWLEWKKSSISGRFLRLGEMVMPYELMFPDEVGTYAYERALFAVAERDAGQIIAPTTWNVLDFIVLIRKNWDKIVFDIENGTITDDSLSQKMRSSLMEKWRKNPCRASELKKLPENAKLSEIWPELKRIVADGSSGLAIYTRQVQDAVGEVELDYGFGLSAEALYARHIVGTEEYQLLTELNFYEFRPVSDNQSNRLFLIDELEIGKLYELYVTTRYGFYRYRLGEVICITDISNSGVRFTRAYKTSETMECFETAFTQQQMDEAVLMLEDDYHIIVNDYVYLSDKDHITVMLELDDSVENISDDMKSHFDSYLRKINLSYSKAIDSGKCEEAELLRLQSQTQMLFRDLRLMKYDLPYDLFRPARYLNTPLEVNFFTHLIQ